MAEIWRNKGTSEVELLRQAARAMRDRGASAQATSVFAAAQSIDDEHTSANQVAAMDAMRRMVAGSTEAPRQDRHETVQPLEDD